MKCLFCLFLFILGGLEANAQNFSFSNLSEVKAILHSARLEVLTADTSQFERLTEQFSQLEQYFWLEQDYESFALSLDEKNHFRIMQGQSRFVIDTLEFILPNLEKSNTDLQTLAILYNSLGFAQEIEGLYENSLSSFDYSLELLSEFPDTNYHKLNAHFGRSNILLEKWGTEETRTILTNSIEKIGQIKRPNVFFQYLLAKHYLLLGDTYTYSTWNITQEKIAKADSILKKGLELSLDCTLSKDNLVAGFINNSIGYMYWVEQLISKNKKEILEKSETYYLKGIEQIARYGGRQHPVLGRSQNNLAMTYGSLLASEVFNNLLSIDSSMAYDFKGGLYAPAHNHSSWSDVFAKSANVFRKTQNQYLKSLNTKQNALNSKHPYLLRNYNNLGSFYLVSSDYKQALKYLQQSIATNLISTDIQIDDYWSLPNKNFENIIDPIQMLRALYWKARVLRSKKVYESDSQIKNKDLKALLATYEYIVGLLEFWIAGYNEKKTQMDQLGRYKWIYDAAINTCIEIYELNKEEIYLEKALIFIEKSKANLSHLFVREQEALKYIDAVAFQQDSLIRKNIASLMNTLLEEEKSLNPEQIKVKQLKKDINELKIEHGILTDKIEKEFPVFKNIKYQVANPSLNKVQNVILANNDSTAILDFYVGLESISIALITKDDFQVFQKKSTKKVNVLIKELRQLLSSKDAAIKDYKNNYLLFIEKSNALYELLLSEILNHKPLKGITHLLIIPSKKLSLIPFELLLLNSQTEIEPDYSKLPYLFKDYNISYAYSLTLLEKSLNDDQKEKAQTNYIGFACSDLKGQPSLAQIAGTKIEVKKGQNIFNGQTFIDEKATEANLRNLKESPQILHLAMHTELNRKKPEQSKFLFCNGLQGSNENDGNLHAYELYGLSNILDKTELAMLTACNTGVGPDVKGEGIVSLSQAFTNSNCKSTLMSLWLVNDESNPQLMELFLQNLKKGQSKSAALRQAKLSYIEKGQNPHPYYWASCILSGNDLAMDFEFKRSFYWLKVGLPLVVFLFGLFFIFIKRQKK